MRQYVQAFVLALTVAYFLTPVVRRFAIRIGALDKPVERSVHREPKPYLGGLAIYVAFALAAAWIVGLGDPLVRGIIVGGGLIVVIGIVDDFLRLSAKVKLLGQIAAAAILVAYGIRIDFLTNPFGDGMIFTEGWAVPLTMFWIVAVVNVVNLIDGLDGLAAGISTIASLTLLFVALQQGGQVEIVLLTAALAGSALGFLPYNFNPAKIFMGDAGAMFLGYALAAVSIQGTLKSAAGLALAIPVLALGLPIFDTAFAIVRRTINGQPIHEADRNHLHHRLMKLGLSHRETVLVMYIISAWLGLSAIVMTGMSLISSLMLLGFVTGALVFGAKKVGVLQVRGSGKNLRH